LVCTFVGASITLTNDFELFLEKFNATFGDLNKEHISNIKIRYLFQGSRSIIVHASEFRQLACNISWGEATFISQFQFGLRGDVKDLILTLLDFSTLSHAITQVVQCDNRLFESQQERRHEPTSITQRSFAPPVTQKKIPPIVLAQPLATSSKDNPMQIDMI
jgi:hypothetical protein